MYLPKHFRIDDPAEIAGLVAGRPLGTLISSGPEGLMADPIPFLMRDGELVAHLSRANPQLGNLRAGGEVLVVFHGPDAYISPNWYATKADTHRVVPTWNYAMVQVSGIPELVDRPDGILELVADLTDTMEATQPIPWSVSDAPETYLQSQLKGIVGLRIRITKIEGKWKVSQNRSETDRDGVAVGLGLDPMADLVRKFAENP